MSSRTSKSLPALALAATIAVILLAPSPCLAAPKMTARLVPSLRSVALDDSLVTDVEVKLPSKTEYLQVRLRVYSATGALVHQKTEIRHDVKGRVRIPFRRELSGSGLAEGVYRAEADVYASGPRRVAAKGSFLLYEPGRPPVDVAVVVRFTHAPMTDPQGRFIVDPTASTVSRDAAVAMEGIVARTRAPVTLAVPPMMLNDWRRIASGYDTAGLEGEREFAADSAEARSYAAATAALARVVRSGRAELLHVPYAEPDIRALKKADALGDLSPQLDLALGEYQASLGATPTSGFAVLGDVVPSAAVPALAESGISYALVRGASVAGDKGRPGALAIDDTTMTALVMDSRLTKLSAVDTDAVLVNLFALRRQPDDTRVPRIILMEIGPGEEGSVDRLERLLRRLQSVPWVRLTSATKASQAEPIGKAKLKRSPWPGTQAPHRYWREVLAARRRALALASAAGDRDADAEYAVSQVMLAQSRAWAGPDSSWALADRGLAHASASRRRSEKTLDRVSLQCSDVTLSGNSGKVPVSIMNASEKDLNVVLRLAGRGTAFPRGAETTVSLKPNENYVTVPVDLGRRASDDVRVIVSANGLELASASVGVRASYLDRLAMVGLVVMVLVGLLLFIRKRGPAEEA